MASLNTSRAYVVEWQGSNFYLVRAGNPINYTITKNLDPEATEFSIGDVLRVYRPDDGYERLLTYQGHTSTGIIASSFDTVYLLTTQVYKVGDVLRMESEAFPVCFVKGTLISTSRGPVTIEHLVAGDTVQGSTGWREVKWVGWRQYGPASFLTQEGRNRIAPIRIRAHAFAENVPDRDLRTSPWHHLLVDGKLVRAVDLLNDVTVVQETSVSDVDYYHVELDQFDVIMAHGVYSESWADGGNRDFFQNVDVTTLRPEDMKRRRAPRPGFDHLILRKGKELAAIQSRVAKRAEAISNPAATVQKAA